MKKSLFVFVATSFALLGGCADRSESVNATYVSPIAYSSYSCRQLSEEAARLSARVSQISGVQDQKAKSDAIATGVSLILFWPAAFLIGGDDETRQELSRLKGEMDAIESVAVRKNCSIQKA
ncbi:hypothetical protein LSUCC0031_13940 [Rhodobacterales bacterium LSUCC0031]|nr:hypothetical protein [Rhodobacterales bacterium LSUCC0031]